MLILGLSESLTLPISVHCIVSEQIIANSTSQLMAFSESIGVELILYSQSKIFDNLNTGARSEISYQKFLFTDFISTKMDYLLYLDIDIVPVAPLDELFQTRFDEAFAGVALDDFVSRRSPRWESIANGGVQVFNIERWKALSMRESAIRYIESFEEKGLLTDEIVLNALLYDEWKRLDPCFNTGYVKCLFMINPVKRSRIRLIHFMGPRKPWKNPIISPLAYTYLKIYRKRAEKVKRIEKSLEEILG